MNPLRGLLGMLLLTVYSCCMAGDGYGFVVEHAQISRESDRYLLSADVQYHLSDDVTEALKHGVALTLTVHLMVYRERDYLWDEVISDVTLPFRVRYHALAQLYQISNESSGVRRNFASLPAALDSLGIIRQMPVISGEQLEDTGSYLASLQVDLDLEALPLPLRPLAYLSPQWYLGSPWYTWPLKR